MARRRFDADIFALSLNRPLPLLLSCRRHRRSCPSTKVAHLDDNLASRAVRLTASERALVASAVPSGDFKGDRFAGGAHANTFKAQMVAPTPSATAAAAAEPPAVAEAASGEGLFCLVVSVEVKPDRVDEFLAAMKIDAEGSRKEPGCRRFDVLRDSSDPNKFLFYEAYVDDAAFATHQTYPHFAPWKAFEASGGVTSLSAAFSTGTYFELGSSCPSEPADPLCLVVSVEVKPDRVDEFLAAMKTDAEGSRKEPGCRRFDVLHDSSDPNKFLFYEAYVDDAAVSAHKAEPHFAPWVAFKASGGVASQAVVFARGVFFGTTLGVARHASP